MNMADKETVETGVEADGKGEDEHEQKPLY